MVDLDGIGVIPEWPVDVQSAEQNSKQRNLSERKPESSEPGLSEVLVELRRLLKLLGVLIAQNQQMLEMVMQLDPEMETTQYLDGTHR